MQPPDTHQRTATFGSRFGSFCAIRIVSSSASTRLIRPSSLRRGLGDHEVAVLERSRKDSAGTALRGRRCSSPGPDGQIESRTFREGFELAYKRKFG